MLEWNTKLLYLVDFILAWESLGWKAYFLQISLSQLFADDTLRLLVNKVWSIESRDLNYLLFTHSFVAKLNTAIALTKCFEILNFNSNRRNDLTKNRSKFSSASVRTSEKLWRDTEDQKTPHSQIKVVHLEPPRDKSSDWAERSGQNQGQS